jgi:hypothetical protein
MTIKDHIQSAWEKSMALIIILQLSLKGLELCPLRLQGHAFTIELTSTDAFKM